MEFQTKICISESLNIYNGVYYIKPMILFTILNPIINVLLFWSFHHRFKYSKFLI